MNFRMMYLLGWDAGRSDQRWEEITTLRLSPI
jgi:hypothetical protein